MTRRLKITQAQTKVLGRNLLAAAESQALGERRLAVFFPELARRLTQGLKQTRAHRRNANLAARHVLCAEALVEVLEARTRDGRGRKGDSRGEIVDEYSALVPAKILAFDKRPAAERRRIQSVYPEVDLRLVRRALKGGALQPQFVAGVLEDPVNYRAFRRTLPRRPVR